MNSKNANNYENVVIRKEQEIGINNFGLEYLVSLEQEIERLNNCYCNRSDCGGRLNKNNEVYDSIQQRNDKAIEYIEKCKEDNWNIDLNDLLDILKGSDKE